MDQWEYCYTDSNKEFVKGFVTTCTPDGDHTVRMPGCAGLSVDAEACAVARLGLDGWEAFTVDQTGRVWFKRRIQG